MHIPIASNPIRSVADLLVGISTEAFFRDFYEKKPLFLDRGDPDFYGDLLGFRDLEYFIETNLDHISTVSATNEEGRRSGYGGGSKVSYVEQVYDKLHDGYSIVLDALQLNHPPLKQMCLALQAETMYRFQTNIYITPPAARAFKLHFDGHDVFVLQTHGTKKWFVDEEPLILPIEGDHYEGPDTMEGRSFTEHNMVQGDLLYVPKGFLHRAESSETDFSIHITLGFHPPIWRHLLTQIVESASRKFPEFRASVPMTKVSGADDETLRAFAQDILGKIDEDFIVRELKEFPHLWGDNLDGQFAGQFLSAVNYLTKGLAKSYQGNASIPVQLYDDDDAFVIRYYGKEVRFPSGAAGAVRYCLQTASFGLADIPGLDDDESREVLIDRLVREGLVLAKGTVT